MEQKYIVALEVGSSKIRGALGVVDRSGILTVKAVEEERLVDSVRNGCVRNVGEVAASVESILRRIENREGGRRITGVYVALGGRSMLASPCQVERRMSADTVINRDHLHQIYEEARHTALNEREVIEAVPAEFFIDNTRVSNPEGAICRQIEALFNLVSCRTVLHRNLAHTLEKSLKLDVRGYIVRQLAEAALVLTPEEKRLGCMLVDFGAETVTVSIYKEGYLCYLATLPMGSRNITRDITSLSYLEENAERLKITGGDALATADSMVTALPTDGTDYTRVNELVSARAGEIIANIEEQIKLAEMTPRLLPAGIVVVGGGAKLRGFNKRLETMTRMKVRTGLPGAGIRITDSRIQPGDAVDVISILASAAAMPSLHDCLEPAVIMPDDHAPDSFTEEIESTPEVPTIDNQRQRRTGSARRHEPINEPDDVMADDDPELDERPRRKSWLSKLQHKVTRLISENEEDIDDTFTDDNK